MGNIILIIAVAIAAIYLTLVTTANADYYKPSILERIWALTWRAVCFAACAVAAWAIIFFIIMVIALPVSSDIRTVSERTVPVKSMVNGTSQSSSYYLALGTGAGSSASENIIKYIAINDDGTYSLTQVKAGNATIREVKGEKNPHVIVKTHARYVEWFTPGGNNTFETMEFVVPEGTVASEISVDLNK